MKLPSTHPQPPKQTGLYMNQKEDLQHFVAVITMTLLFSVLLYLFSVASFYLYPLVVVFCSFLALIMRFGHVWSGERIWLVESAFLDNVRFLCVVFGVGAKSVDDRDFLSPAFRHLTSSLIHK